MGNHMRSIERWHLQWAWWSPNPVFWSRISRKQCVLGTKLLKNANRIWYTIYRMIPLSMTLSDLWPPISRSRHFSTLNISETTRDRAIVTIECQQSSYLCVSVMIKLRKMSIESHMRSIAWCHFQWPWRTPNQVFKIAAFLKLNISKTYHIRDNVSIEH